MADKAISLEQFREALKAIRNSTISEPDLSVRFVENTPNLNAAEGEPGYIQGRTHWSEYKTVEILPETAIDASEGEAPILTPYTVLPTVGNTYTVMYNGTAYECKCESVDMEGITGVAFGNGAALGFPFESDAPFFMILLSQDGVEAAGYYGVCLFLDGSTSATMSIIGDAEIVHKLPQKYYNASDWDAASEDEAGFVKNRPFGYVMTVCATGSGVLQSTVADVGACEIPMLESVLPGDVCSITYEGKEYTRIVEDLYYIGNYDYIFNNGENNAEPFCIVFPSRSSSDDNCRFFDLTGKAAGETVVITVKKRKFATLPSEYLTSLSEDYAEPFDYPTFAVAGKKSLKTPYENISTVFYSPAALKLFDQIDKRGFAYVLVSFDIAFPGTYIDYMNSQDGINMKSGFALSDAYMFTVCQVRDDTLGGITYYCACEAAIGLTLLLAVSAQRTTIGSTGVSVSITACPHNTAEE